MDAGAIQLDVAGNGIERAQLLIQRSGFVGDPIAAEHESQNVVTPLCTVPGVRFGTGYVAQASPLCGPMYRTNL